MPRFLIHLVIFGFGVLTVSDLHAGLTPHVQWNKDTLPSFMPGVDSIRFMEDVVITGTRTARRSAESPVMVTVMDSRKMAGLQVCVLSDALRFQPGLRVETNCQTCNYTQLRMNGLAGAYTQILVNGRPLFGPMMSLYGMEQLPVNMIDRIEVVRGGGSSLYGPSAIGGTVNVITRTPVRNQAEVGMQFQHVGGRTADAILSGNGSLVSTDKRTGLFLFLNRRVRGVFDANGDGFSELPELRNLSSGLSFFHKPAKDQKLELTIGYLGEYRYGGEITDKSVELAGQAEERRHRTWMGSMDYQVNFNGQRSSVIAYGAWQLIQRSHYTGVLPDDPAELAQHILEPPFGEADAATLNTGFQLNHRVDRFLKGTNTFTLGSELVYDKVTDNIPAYGYEVDQQTRDFGVFLQSDWQLSPKLTMLSGIRTDLHNMLPGRVMMSPRLSILYRPWPSTQIRLGYGKGFRAPQAFDTDLHLAFAGGGVSRVQLDNDLLAERSNSWSLSWNADHATENRIFGYTVEAFRTNLLGAFNLFHIGRDAYGEIFEKRNGSAARVQGITVELRGNIRKKLQLEGGFTLQQSAYDDAVEYMNGVPPERNFLRTPDAYGFSSLTLMPSSKWNINLSHVHTGRMRLAHFGSEGNQPADRMIETKPFDEINLRVSRFIRADDLSSVIECSAGVRNLLNAWQDDFDRGKYRDSNYIYGPAQPRSLFVAVKWRFN